MTGMYGDHWVEVRIETTGWMPSPQHCRVVRQLRSYTAELDAFIGILREAAEGLELPHFTLDFGPDYDYEDGHWAVEGYRIKTPDDVTEAELIAQFNEKRERELLTELKAKYEVGA